MKQWIDIVEDAMMEYDVPERSKTPVSPFQEFEIVKLIIPQAGHSVGEEATIVDINKKGILEIEFKNHDIISVTTVDIERSSG